MIQAAKPAMTASIKVASRALYSSSFNLPQDSFISFTVWHSDLFLPIQWEIVATVPKDPRWAVLAFFCAAMPPSMHFQMLDGMHILGPSPHCPMAAIGD
jgi:hypothetical protein